MSRSEQALVATRMPTVIVRPAWFAQNFTEASFAPSISADAAAVLSPHMGLVVRHDNLPAQDWVAGAVGNGLPADYAGMLGMLFTLIRDGYDAGLSDGVQRALGRPATSFEDWAAREANSLR